MRKNCSSDQEKLLKFEAEGQEFAKFLRSLEQFIQTEKGQKNFWQQNDLLTCSRRFLTELPNSGWAKAHPAHPLATALLTVALLHNNLSPGETSFLIIESYMLSNYVHNLFLMY